MALTADMTVAQLGTLIAKSAQNSLEEEIKLRLQERAQPIIDEAAKHLASLIEPMLVKTWHTPEGEIRVTLILNNKEIPIQSRRD